jgi:hypothetical protein
MNAGARVRPRHVTPWRCQVPQYFSAGSEFEVETTQDMNPHKPGTEIMPGMAKAHLTVYEEGEECSTTLPTVGDLLAKHVDPSSGLLSLRGLMGRDLDLKMDPTPLRALSQDRRVGPGMSFVTHAARNRARTDSSARQ